MSLEPSSTRWSPFQCPACFGLFRLRKSDVGRTGRCPTCGIAVETLEKSYLIEADQEFLIEESRRELFEKVAVAQEMTPGELEALEGQRRSRKRVYAGGAGPSGTGWDQGGINIGRGRAGWKTWLSGFLLLMIVAGFGVNYLITRKLKKADEANKIARAETDRVLEGFEIQEKKDDGMRDLIERYSEFDQVEIETVVRGFLNAPTVAEKKAFVREPERVSSLMDHYYTRKAYEPEGFESLNRQETSFRGEFVVMTVQNSDFLNRMITVERVSGDEGYSYRVDWESWVGYGEYSPEEMREKRPETPFLIRAVVEVADYYNYGFSDDSEWRSYGLEMGETGFLFLGYVLKGSELDQQLSPIRKKNLPESLILKVVYPPKARAKDQVEILEILSSNGWVLSDPEKAGDE